LAQVLTHHANPPPYQHQTLSAKLLQCTQEVKLEFRRFNSKGQDEGRGKGEKADVNEKEALEVAGCVDCDIQS